jgi:uncharacterized Zn finger protein
MFFLSKYLLFNNTIYGKRNENTMVHEIIQAQCPDCSPDEPVPHSILKEKPDLLIKCIQCGAIHPHHIEKKRKKEVRVVVSSGEFSFTRKLTLDSDETLTVDDEFVVEDESTGEASFVIVTSIETDFKRVNVAKANAIQTVWARSTDKVIAKISITKGWQTESIEMEVPGDREFTVGEILKEGEERFLIKKIKTREGGFLKEEGNSAQAKHIKRIFADSMERVEFLSQPKKTYRKISHGQGGSIIRPRGTASWILKTKGGD